MFKKVIQFLKEVKQELLKVSWPSRNEVWTSTFIVIGFSLALSFIIWIIDLIYSRTFYFIMR